MIRFVVGPDRHVVPDLTATLPGRGIWLSARADVIETARTRGAFARAAARHVTGGQVAVAGDLLSVLRTGLLRRVTELLGLARRAGQAVAGFEKGREWLSAGRAGLVIQAADGSAAECRRFMSGVRVAVFSPLNARELGAVFGRDAAVHVVVAPGKLAGMLGIECERLAGLMAAPDGDGTKTVGDGADGTNKRAGA